MDPDVDAISNSPVVGDRPGRRQAPHPLLAHHEDVHLPGGLRRRQARDHRDRRRRRRAAPGRVHPGKRAWPRSPSRSARSRCASSPTTSTSRTRARRWTWSPSRTSPPVPWRTWAASPSATRRSSSTRRRRPAPSSSGWPTSSRTSSPTCGSATSSRWGGGRASGSTRPSPPSWRRSASTPSGPPGTAGSASPRHARRRSPSTACTPPVRSSTRSGPPKEAEGMFDLLTYEKGCGVLRMLEQHIGPDVFRDGVRTYLKAHAYGNTVTSRPVGRARGRQRRAGARRHGHLHPPGRAPARARCDGDTLSQQPFALGPVPAGRHVVHRVARGTCPSPCAPCPAQGEPGAPVRHLVLGTRTRADRGGRARASPWSMPAAGACSGSATRRSTGWRWPTISPSSPRSSGPTCSPTPGPPPWPVTSSLREFLVLVVAARDSSRTPRRGPRWAAPSCCATGSPGPSTRPRCADAVAALVGPTHRRLGFDADPGRGRAHPVAARARHQPPGHRRRRRGGAQRRPPAASTRRRSAVASGDADPGRHRVGDAGRRGAAGAPG